MKGVLSLVADLREEETGTALLMTVNGFLLLMAYSCIKPVREALILAHAGGAEYKAYMAGATALILLVAVPLYSRASAGLPRNRLVVGTTMFFTANLLSFYAVGATMGSTLPFALAFYLWIAIFNMMTVAQFWAFANDLHLGRSGSPAAPAPRIRRVAWRRRGRGRRTVSHHASWRAAHDAVGGRSPGSTASSIRTSITIPNRTIRRSRPAATFLFPRSGCPRRVR